MDKLVTLKIDGRTVSAPAGTLVVDAAKMAGITIPVFCYHPKLEPVGMCRMCLVDIGRPAVDRATGQPILNEDGTPRINFGPKLETACTTPVSEGMVVWGATEKVMAARKEILEFLLTSHPLDCPVCDKGGECPLQNQTMAFGPGESRFIYNEKNHLEKHVPLGDLIWLDRERCIQCARCVRFADQVVDDPAIGFYQRGRTLEIVTYSEPGFDSIFSGNTTDICPVGALTTADFRFGARSWEMKEKASICTQCPVGCNITYHVRREAASGGKIVIKRVMPRQHEAVNEMWICDKGRFTHHYTESPERLTTPLIRRNGELSPASWEEALRITAEKLKAAGGNLVTLAGGKLLNEDLAALKKFSGAVGCKPVLYSRMGGGEWTTRVGMAPGSNLGSLGKGSAILVFASELHEEAPIWWLRVKQAAERGALLIVAAGRKTRLEKFAAHVLPYAYGSEEKVLRELLAGESEAAKAFAAAENAVIFMGSDGLGVQQSEASAALCAELLVKTNHYGKPDNGLIAVWPEANHQAASEMGLKVDPDLKETLSAAMGVCIAGADPAGDDPELSDAIQRAGFLVVQDLFLTETARLADVVLPMQASAERDGSVVSGERRVQRLFAAVPAPENTRTGFEIIAGLASELNLDGFQLSVEQWFDHLCVESPRFTGLSYAKLEETAPQWPDTGRRNMYFSGTVSENVCGLGAVLPIQSGGEGMPVPAAFPPVAQLKPSEFLAVPVTRVYDLAPETDTTALIQSRLPKGAFSLHPQDAQELGLVEDSPVVVNLNGRGYPGKCFYDKDQPRGTLLVIRGMGVPLAAPSPVQVTVPAVENYSNR